MAVLMVLVSAQFKTTGTAEWRHLLRPHHRRLPSRAPPQPPPLLPPHLIPALSSSDLAAARLMAVLMVLGSAAGLMAALVALGS
ncbi:Os02g0297732 [Oryza sativa Japonica Group]|uniref:Os02g0297732 protein n=1 Tax=Oryza sativa subsp. japonica TaxID=39947 RepID=A0A0P0VI11_ORYSJ|nr:Os02g0297732 [Oryza sativa Japonica Group]